MSDRVAIIGGAVPGRDHFPWPVAAANLADDDSNGIPDSIQDGSEWPIALTAQKACDFLLRVKTWKVTVGTITQNDAVPPETYTGFEFYITLGNDNNSTELTRESDLVIPFNAQQFSDIYEHSSGILPHLYVRGFIILRQGSLGGAFEFSNPIFYSGLIRPYLVVSVGLAYSDDPDPDPDFSVIQVSTNKFPTPSNNSGTLTVVLPDGSTKAAPLFSDPDHISVDITMEPSEYWPYAARDGSPIYDTATGAQLQDPLN